MVLLTVSGGKRLFYSGVFLINHMALYAEYPLPFVCNLFTIYSQVKNNKQPRLYFQQVQIRDTGGKDKSSIRESSEQHGFNWPGVSTVTATQYYPNTAKQTNTWPYFKTTRKTRSRHFSSMRDKPQNDESVVNGGQNMYTRVQPRDPKFHVQKTIEKEAQS